MHKLLLQKIATCLIGTILTTALFYPTQAIATTAADFNLSGATQTLASGQTVDEPTILDSSYSGHVLSTSNGGIIDSFTLATVLYNNNTDRTGTTTLINNGIIDFSADIQSTEANLAAIYALDNTVYVENNGTININASAIRTSSVGGTDTNDYFAYASAIYADGTTITVLNTGTITLTATSTTTQDFCVHAYGINVYGSGTVSNTGTITITAKSEADFAKAHGYYLVGDITAINSGTITAIAIAESTKYATAYAIDAGAGVGSIINSGYLYASAQTSAQTSGGTATAYGIYVTPTDDTTVRINNTGTITATATSTSGTANAYGIYIDTTGATDKSSIGIIVSNTGIINTSAANSSYSLGTNGGGYVYIDTWALTLTGSAVDPLFYVTSDSGMYFKFGIADDTGAHFIVRADENTQYGYAYSLADMVTKGNNATVDGYIGSVSTELPFLVATLGTSDGDVATNYATQTITLSQNITPWTSPGHGMASISATNAQSHMNNLSTILASQLNSISKGAHSAVRPIVSGDHDLLVASSNQSFSDAGNALLSAPEEHWRAFLMPYFSHANNHDFNYETDMVGIATGASYVFNEAFTAGFHLNLGQANTEGAYLDSDAQALTLGVHAMYTICPELYVRAHLSGYVSQADNLLRGTGASSLLADVDTDSLGFFASLSTGYDWKLNTQHTITPEIGLSYMYSKTDGYDVNYQVAGQNIYSMSYDDSDFDIVYAEASLRWTGEYALGNKEDGSSYGLLKPTARLGLRQALNDAEIASTMHFYGTSATTYSDANESAFIAEAGLSWIMDDVTLCFTYTGDFGDVEDIHMGMMKVSVAF